MLDNAAFHACVWKSTPPLTLALTLALTLTVTVAGTVTVTITLGRAGCDCGAAGRYRASGGGAYPNPKHDD